ncbi:DUF2971 domain-containing protein [Sneathiella sp.]|uniref:DUF2971 domain-containing protein n=1 Tax=Sneathiella sp. TaxID=1964365 RepID=UPI002FE28739
MNDLSGGLETDFSADTKKFFEIFCPGFLEDYEQKNKSESNFVYYTSAETAINILRNRELWFRNAKVMNDFSEISYGIDLIRKVFKGPEGENFRTAVNAIFPYTIHKTDELVSAWLNDWQYETYIACVSSYDPKEDKRGRLSMWRAYGDVALVVKNTPMRASTDKLGVYSLPVRYSDEAELTRHLSEITNAVKANGECLKGLGREWLIGSIHSMCLRLAIATKHPGFKEEDEWRLYHRPNAQESPCMKKDVAVIRGVPQPIYKLRLAHEPENGLFGADIPSLLDRIIIGPTQYPYVAYRAFVEVLRERGVEVDEDKVVVSDIPLRVW